jgi:hypothetical protein
MNFYRENIKKYRAKTNRLKKVLNRISILRLSIFVVSGIALITLFSFNLIHTAGVVLAVSVTGFGWVVKHHIKIAVLKKHTLFLEKINEAEILRGECKLDEFDAGHQFINPDHPYTSDLDIFGQHSVFQLVNRTTTESGRIRLAEWLTKPAPGSEINDRQNGIKELAENPEWRQDFQASGMHFQNKNSDYKKLLDWAEKPVVLLKNRLVYLATAIVLSVLTLLALTIFIISLDTPNGYIYLSLLLLLFVNYLVLRKVKPLAEDIVFTAQHNISTLKGYRSLINKIEKERFRSEKLHRLQSVFINGKYSATREIGRLCRLLEFSQQRGINRIKIPIKGNPFYSILNSFLLLDIYLVAGAEKWKQKNRAFLKLWAEAVSEFEAISSFAGYSFSNPSYTFPEITEKNNTVHFELLGHPLIPPGKRVCNSFHSEGPGDMVLITGSNMGGKSTFLRSAGVNLVLALAGAPCCAKYAQVSNLKVFTSMRTRDNLREGVSSFYAELARIEKMLKLIETRNDVFFLLDEMFKGTNSEDRHKGGFSLINQLKKLKTSGIIATHDIELARLCETKRLVANCSFNSEIRNDTMFFSYKLHPGICTDFNASALMQRSGIQIISGHSKSKT